MNAIQQFEQAWRENDCGDSICADVRLEAALLVLTGSKTDHRFYARVIAKEEVGRFMSDPELDDAFRLLVEQKRIKKKSDFTVKGCCGYFPAESCPTHGKAEQLQESSFVSG